MSQNKNIIKWIFLVHLLFWALLTVLVMLVLKEVLLDQTAIITATAVNLCGFMALAYGHLYFLLPRYFDRKQYLKYLTGLALLILGTALLRFLIGWGLVVEMQLGLEDRFTPTYFGSMIFSGTFFLILSIPLRLVQNWFKQSELVKELKTHQLEAELRFLKAQVNPHFLFNALNNIYSLSFTESKKAPDMILKLSDMMSYMLYDCKSELVKLRSEVDYLYNYIDLQQLKKDGEFNISFEVSGDISSTYITPMLFIPFFENAFKHGNLDDTKNGWLKSTLHVANSQLTFESINTISDNKKPDTKGGVGLQNIKDRLQLLFPDAHELIISQSNDLFTIRVSINLLKYQRGTSNPQPNNKLPNQ